MLFRDPRRYISFPKVFKNSTPYRRELPVATGPHLQSPLQSTIRCEFLKFFQETQKVLPTRARTSRGRIVKAITNTPIFPFSDSGLVVCVVGLRSRVRHIAVTTME